MKPRRFILTAAALSALAFPAAAHAACERPGVTVTAAKQAALVDESVSYGYALCFTSTPDRYDVQVYAITISDGEIAAERPMTSAQGASIAGKSSPVTGNGSYAASATGDYLVRVRYYAAGQSNAESVGEAVWHVDPKPLPPTPQPPTPPKPEPQGPTVTAPTPEPTPEPQGQPARARLKLTKRAAHRSIKPGRTARFVLTVKNTSNVTAAGVQVCDRLPARTQYVNASKPVVFKGAHACVKVGFLKAGASSRVTVTLRIDRTAKAGRIVNHATATATNADTAKANATVNVPRVIAPRITAPVTG